MVISEIFDLFNKTFSTMPWSGILILLAVAFIIRLLEGDFNISRSRRSRPRIAEDEDDDEFEWIRVRRPRR